MARRAHRGKLLGNAPLGQGQGGGVAGPDRFVGPPYYLINDTFTTDRAAGAVNGTDAEPGPGRRETQDTNGKLSLSGGSVVLATGGAATGNPRLWYGSTMMRTSGRLCVARGATTSSGGVEVGWDINTAGGITEAIRLFGTTLTLRVNGVTLTVGAIVAATDYDMIVIQRVSLGSLFFVKGGAFVNWTLIWVSADPTSNPRIPTFCSASTTSVGTISFFRVPAERWLPAPLLSDGFSTFAVSAPTATDGLGHAEGIAGGLGAGGGGVWPYTQVGTWQASGGVASASALSSGVALAYMDVGTLDLIATVKIAVAGGTAGLIVRGDANNHVRAIHTGTNAQLVKLVAGVATTLIDAVATYVAGAEIRVICEGTKFRLFYNNVAIGTEQTVADAALNTDGYAGIRSTNTANTFDDLVVRARGSGGEYAALDAF